MQLGLGLGLGTGNGYFIAFFFPLWLKVTNSDIPELFEGNTGQPSVINSVRTGVPGAPAGPDGPGGPGRPCRGQKIVACSHLCMLNGVVPQSN